MEFLIKKYKISSLSDLVFHKNIYKTVFPDLKNIPEDKINDYCNWPKDFNEIEGQLMECDTIEDMSTVACRFIEKKKILPLKHDTRYMDIGNILIFGPSGSGKHSLLNLLLEDMFDKQVHEIEKNSYKIEDYGNSVEEVDIYESDYHMIIEPTNSGLDKHIVHEIICPYASKPLFNIKTNNYVPFRVIVINNAHKLISYAQNALRCIMEKYNNLCKFILVTTQISRISDPLRSRCMPVAFPAPSYDDLKVLLFKICCTEGIKLPDEMMNTIIVKSNYNTKVCLWLLENYMYGNTDFELAWITKIKKIAKIICAFNSNRFEKMTRRELVNKYLSTVTYKKYIEQVLYKIDKQKIDKICTKIFSNFPDLFHDDINVPFGVYIMNKYKDYCAEFTVTFDVFKAECNEDTTILNENDFYNIHKINTKQPIKLKVSDKLYEKTILKDKNDDADLKQILRKHKFKMIDITSIIKCGSYDDYIRNLYDDYNKKMKTFDEFVAEQDITTPIFMSINAAKSQVFESIINNDTMEFIKDTLYNIYITNIPQDEILAQLFSAIVELGKDINPILLVQIATIFSNNEQHMVKGTRTVVNIETIIKQILYHINKFNKLT